MGTHPPAPSSPRPRARPANGSRPVNEPVNEPVIRPAASADVATILRFVRDLAAFEREPDAVVATEAMLADALFGTTPAADASHGYTR